MSENDMDLLEHYVRDRSEESFGAIVEQYLGLVYSAALRQVGSAQLAEEVAQSVFTDLALNAHRLAPDSILSAWLYQVARRTALNVVRREARRKLREQFYVEMNAIQAAPEDWKHILPHFDDAMDTLDKTSRTAILLRYFQNKSLREVGLALGTSDDAAQKRIGRALEKLRSYFQKRGVASTSAFLADAISANSILVVPAALAKSITTAAAAKGIAVSASTSAFTTGALKFMALTNAKAAAVVGLCALLAVGTISVAIFSFNLQDRDARQILTRTIANYSQISSYEGSGTTTEAIDGSQSTPLEATFTMRLGRQGLFRIQYEQHGSFLTNKAIVWSDGRESYFTNQMVPLQKARASLQSGLDGVQDTLSMINDVSGGVVAVVPSMFFGIQIPNAKSSKPGRLDSSQQWLAARLTKEPDEKIGNVDCYVLCAEQTVGKAWLWIGKNDFLVRRSRQVRKLQQPEATEEEIKSMLAAFRPAPALDVKETQRKVNKARKQAADTMQDVRVVLFERKAPRGSGLNSLSITVHPPGYQTSTQTHDDIAVNYKYSPTDFAP